MYKASVNNSSFDITVNESGIQVNSTPLDWNLVEISDGYFHILSGNKSYNAEVVNMDSATKSFSLKINGRIYAVNVKDKFDMLLEKMGLNSPVAGKINTIKAPMPGLIIDLRVQPGDTVSPGDALLILEAMKMENIIKASGEGTVKSVKVRKGDSVEKNQVLIEF
jgi:biotin carboxyl carrier protein